MKGHRQRALAALALIVALGVPAGADDLADTRAELAARMFRAFLSADVDLDKKAIDNRLVIVFLYNENRQRATSLASNFLGQAKDGGTIHGFPLAVEYSSDISLAAYKSRVPAGIFLAQPVPAQTLRSIARYGIEHHVIVYSPFEGDVERGVLGGIAVEAQVRPYVNWATLSASNINLKELFFKVTKVFR